MAEALHTRYDLVADGLTGRRLRVEQPERQPLSSLYDAVRDAAGDWRRRRGVSWVLARGAAAS